MTNDSGMVITSHEYLPFGESWITEGDTKNAPKYNSQELDKESGYYFYNARHYDPEIARFVTPDTVIPVEFDTQGWNRYMYCRGNPIRYNDPTGHDWRDNVLSKAQSVGEGIRNVGEKITQPLRDAGNALRDKLNGNLQNKANSTGSRINGNNNAISSTTGTKGLIFLNHPFDGYVQKNGTISVPQGLKNHGGIDKQGKLGDPIYSMGNGKIGAISLFPNKDNVNTIVVDKKSGYHEWYQHVTPGPGIKTGVEVKAGDILGYLDNSGVNHKPSPWWDGGHLHFTVRNKANIPVDPIPYLSTIYPGVKWGFSTPQVENYMKNNYSDLYNSLNRKR